MGIDVLGPSCLYLKWSKLYNTGKKTIDTVERHGIIGPNSTLRTNMVQWHMASVTAHRARQRNDLLCDL